MDVSEQTGQDLPDTPTNRHYAEYQNTWSIYIDIFGTHIRWTVYQGQYKRASGATLTGDEAFAAAKLCIAKGVYR